MKEGPILMRHSALPHLPGLDPAGMPMGLRFTLPSVAPYSNLIKWVAPQLNCLSSLMQSLKLNFIPTNQERERFYEHISPQTSKYTSCVEEEESQQVEYHQEGRKLNKQELSNLLERLSISNKQAFVKDQIAKIQIRNKEWEEIKQRQRKSKCNHQVEQRLLEEGRKKKQKLESMRKAKAQEETRQLRQKPIITDRYLYNYRPLKDRVPQIIQAQKINLKAIEQETKPKFNPTINRYSAFIAEIKNQNTDFANRLHNNEKVVEKKQVMKTQIEEKMKKELTFQPKINPKSKVLAQNFRQANEAIKSRIVQQLGRQSFQPKICRKSDLIVKNSNNGSFMERLENDHHNRKVKQVELDSIRRSQCSFRPKINPNSRRLCQSRRTNENSSREELSIQDTSKPVSAIKKSSSVASKQFAIFSNLASERNRSKLQQLFGRKYSTLDE